MTPEEARPSGSSAAFGRFSRTQTKPATQRSASPPSKSPPTSSPRTRQRARD